MITALIILGSIVVYAAGIATTVAILGHLAGKKGKELYSERLAYRRRRSLSNPRLNGYEVAAGWAIVWPGFIPAGIVLGLGWLVIFVVDLYSALFEKTQKQALEVKTRQKELA